MTRAELAALVEAMTPGPWFYRENWVGSGVNRNEKRVYSVEICGDGRGADCRPWFEGCGFKRWSSRVIAVIQDWAHWTDHPHNRDGIVALRNEATRLLAIWKAAEEYVAAVESDKAYERLDEKFGTLRAAMKEAK